jgi:hypothetical protein
MSLNPLRRVTGKRNPPHECGRFEIPLSDRAAASITPDEAIGTDATARHNHDCGTLDHDRRGNHDDATIDPATAVGSAMEAGTASTGGVRCTKAGDRAGKQDCCEKGLHVSSVLLGHIAAPDQ